jgi:mRNA interferase MazF
MSKATRGEIWEGQFRPAIGAEIQKTRPAVIMNVPEPGRLPLSIVVPLTEWKPEFAHFSWFVPIPPTATNGLTKQSGADAFQVKSVSEGRLVRRWGHITPEQTE